MEGRKPDGLSPQPYYRLSQVKSAYVRPGQVKKIKLFRFVPSLPKAGQSYLNLPKPTPPGGGGAWWVATSVLSVFSCAMAVSQRMMLETHR